MTTNTTAPTPFAQALNHNPTSIDPILKAHGITPATLNAWRHGNHQPAPWIARQLANALNQPVTTLFPNP